MSDVLTFENWDEKTYQTVMEGFGDYFDVIKWAYRAYKNNEIVYACSFGAEGIVLVDLISKINKSAHVAFLDTGLHFNETYQLIDVVKDKYPLMNIELITPKLTLREQALQYGDKLWEKDTNLCCHIRKILPLQSLLDHKLAWLSGLRRDEFTRKNVQYINKDTKFKTIKICPLIHWSWEDVWDYITLNKLPYNPLHEQKYPSIGCVPCTSTVNDGEDLRAGRWSNLDKTECGIHSK